MRVALVKIKSSFVFIVFVQCLSIEYAEAQTVDENSRIARKVCRLKPEPGPCRANIATYYFDPESLTCEKFSWGGCQGNGNRFSSSEQCYSHCITNAKKIRPKYCNLNFDYGYCFGALKRYHYDPLWKVCKERLYSGCGGNLNNFYNIDQCEQNCLFANGNSRSITMKGKAKKVLIINPDEKDGKKKHNKKRTTAAPA